MSRYARGREGIVWEKNRDRKIKGTGKTGQMRVMYK